MKSPLEPYRGMQDDYDLVIVDTEFTRLPGIDEPVAQWLEQTQLLSLAMLGLDEQLQPARLYGTRKMDARLFAQCPPFVREQVLPKLDAEPVTGTFDDASELREPIAEFLDQRARQSGKAVALVADWPGDLRILDTFEFKEVAHIHVGNVVEVAYAMAEEFNDQLLRHNAMHDAVVIAIGLRNYLRIAQNSH